MADFNDIIQLTSDIIQENDTGEITADKLRLLVLNIINDINLKKQDDLLFDDSKNVIIIGGKEFQLSPYLHTFNIKVLTDPTGAGTVSGGGDYLEGSLCTIKALNSNPQYRFILWQLNGGTASNEAEYTFPVDENKTFIAKYLELPKYLITVHSMDEDMGTVSGGGEFYRFEGITIVAEAKPGYKFSRWTLSPSDEAVTASANAEHHFTVSGNRDFYAWFEPAEIDYYVGQTTNENYFRTLNDAQIISNATEGYVSATPQYPSNNSYEYFGGLNKLFYVLYRDDLYDVLIDFDNPGTAFDLTDLHITDLDPDGESYHGNITTDDNITYKVIAASSNQYSQENGYRIKFTRKNNT